MSMFDVVPKLIFFSPPEPGILLPWASFEPLGCQLFAKVSTPSFITSVIVGC